MAFNEHNCKVLHTAKSNPHYSMNDKMLYTVSDVKDLGIIVTDTLSFSNYIATAKVNRIFGLIKNIFYVDKELFLGLFQTYAHLHLEYCILGERKKPIRKNPEVCNYIATIIKRHK